MVMLRDHLREQQLKKKKKATDLSPTILCTSKTFTPVFLTFHVLGYETQDI